MKQVFASGATFYLQKPVDRQKLSTLFRTVRGSMYEGRRRYVRVPLHGDVVCMVDAREVHGVTWNLSQGGMQVDVGHLKPGQSVRLAFRLSSSATLIDATGSVVWVGEKRQGIRFEHLGPKQEKAIRDFIAEVEADDAREKVI